MLNAVVEQRVKLCNVAVSGPKGRLLTYALPKGTDAESLVGHRVKVPIGNRTVIGVVVENGDGQPPHGLKMVREVLDPLGTPSFPPELLELTRWVAEYYLCDWVEVLKAALPAGLFKDPELLAEWIGPEMECEWPSEVLADRNLLRLGRSIASHQKTSSHVLAKESQHTSLYASLRRLETAGLITTTEKLALDREKASTVEEVRVSNGTKVDDIPARSRAQRRAFELLVEHGGKIDWLDLREAAGIERSVLNVLEERGYVKIERVKRTIASYGFDPRGGNGNGNGHTPEPPLIQEQSSAVAQLDLAIDSGNYHGFLLTGVPGTGKTRVYIEALKEALAAGKGAILMVPEIGLTPQVVARIRSALDAPVSVLHSGLSANQRVAAWRDVLEGKTRVVVGPRSAVFAPVKNLGLIVVDEEHEESYKQQEPAPRYHARDVALMRGTKSGASVLLVSATPSMEAVRLSKEGQLTQLNLSERFGAGWPTVTVADRRRDAADAFYIGDVLSKAINERAEKNEGVVLLITRRGFASVLFCHDCGYREECPNCAVTMTYHKTAQPFLRCHLCGYTKQVPEACPSCRSSNLQPLGAGTQRIEEEVQERFPHLMPVRMDGDTLKKHGAHEKILRAFADGESNLLLGTQVVAKGHDFSHVTLVGVVNADPALNQPDFRSSERTFRLLVQAAGRAGRGEKPGEMIVQTLTPDHELFKSLSGPDVKGYMQTLATQRRAFSYPPFSRMIMLTVAGDEPEATEKAANEVVDFLDEHAGGVSVRGPVPAYVKRIKRKWRWRIMLSVPRDVDSGGKSVRELVRKLLASYAFNSHVSCIVDVDPLEVS